MNSMSDETKELLEKHVGIHGTAILACMTVMLMKNGYDAEPIGVETHNIWEAGLRIKNKDDNEGEMSSADYFIHNTLIEIFCVDRDDDPLIFDENHEEDFMYTINKIGEVLEGRYILLTGVFEGKTVEEIYEENPGKFERIRKKEVDPNHPEEAYFK